MALNGRTAVRDAPTALQLSRSSAGDTVVARKTIACKDLDLVSELNRIWTIRAPQQTSRLNRCNTKGGISAECAHPRRLFVTPISSLCELPHSQSTLLAACLTCPQSAKRRKHSNRQVHYDDSDAMRGAGRTLLALTTASPSFAQTRTTMPNGYPSHYCLPTTVDSAEERRLLRRLATFRQGW